MEPLKKPEFSICIPAYEMKGKGSQYLGILFNSIDSQTHRDFEVIVSDHSVDDAVKDLCEKWKDRFPLTYLRYAEHRGNASYNTNNAIRHATGKVIHLLHQDDFMYSEQCLEKMHGALAENPAKHWGAVSYIHTDAEGKEFFRPLTPHYNPDIIRAKNTIGAPSVIFYRNSPDRPLLDEHLIWMNDCELCYRLHKAYGDPLIISDTLIAIRQWSDSVTNNTVTETLKQEEIAYSLKKHRLPLVRRTFLSKVRSRLGYLFVRPYRLAATEIQSILLRENPLTRLANRYRSDKGTRTLYKKDGPRHFYTEYYEPHFKALRDKPIRFMEIGIGSGPSLKIWPQYFSKAKIYAIDIDDFSRLNTDRVTCLQADQSDRGDLARAVEKIDGPLDVIVDDGGHYMNQQQTSFGFLFKYLKSGGMYFIEDLHTSYWPHNGYTAVYNDVPIDIDADRKNTTMAMINNYIQNKKITSKYLTPEEIAYLDENIASCVLYDTASNKYGPNHLVVFTKK